MCEGLIRVRFELSTLPRHQGTRTVVIRILEILEPIQPNHPSSAVIPVPQVGELLIGKYDRVATFNLDAKHGSPLLPLLRLLYDSDVKHGTLEPTPHVTLPLKV